MLTLGFSPFIIIALDNVMIIAMNAVLQHYGGAAREMCIRDRYPPYTQSPACGSGSAGQ